MDCFSQYSDVTVINHAWYAVVGQFLAVVAYQVFRDITYFKKMYRDPEVNQKWHKWAIFHLESLILIMIFYLLPDLIYYFESDKTFIFHDTLAGFFAGLSSLCYLVYWVIHPVITKQEVRLLFDDSIISKSSQQEP